MAVITRFAPSPTGYLHIGGARTALFNWLFAQHHKGQMLLRIEDTDQARSTEEAVNAINEGLTWLGLNWQGKAISQFSRSERHADVARDLINRGNAYHCYCTPAELAEMRQQAKADGRSIRYDGRCRDGRKKRTLNATAPVIRLKSPKMGTTIIDDLVQGEVSVKNAEMDDMVLLRSDGTPTYMLAVVVDDHDMNISHIIRGDDHLTNAVRQCQIYNLMDWKLPAFAHIPLIHGSDGHKLSKRHGALGIKSYQEMGFLPSAIRNYLLRLGWSHGNHEIISDQQAVSWFDLGGVGKSAARFDVTRLESLNSHYIRNMEREGLIKLLANQLRLNIDRDLSNDELARLGLAIDALKERAKTLVELADTANFLIAKRPLRLEEKAAGFINDEARKLLAKAYASLEKLEDWTLDNLTTIIRDLAQQENLKLGKLAQPLRSVLTASTTSPGIFEVLFFLGRQESLDRINDYCG